MSTYTQICYHIVFATKDRQRVLRAERRAELFRYIWGLLKNQGCHLYRINGGDDHLHILTSLHPTKNLATVVKEIKTSSAAWIKDGGVFPNFTHWQDGYAAFTHSKSQIEDLIAYIKGQDEHHQRTTFAEEYRKFLEEAGIAFDERYVA